MNLTVEELGSGSGSGSGDGEMYLSCSYRVLCFYQCCCD